MIKIICEKCGSDNVAGYMVQTVPYFHALDDEGEFGREIGEGKRHPKTGHGSDDGLLCFACGEDIEGVRVECDSRPVPAWIKEEYDDDGDHEAGQLHLEVLVGQVVRKT